MMVVVGVHFTLFIELQEAPDTRGLGKRGKGENGIQEENMSAYWKGERGGTTYADLMSVK
jgi:hypothetical protein